MGKPGSWPAAMVLKTTQSGGSGLFVVVVSVCVQEGVRASREGGGCISGN